MLVINCQEKIDEEFCRLKREHDRRRKEDELLFGLGFVEQELSFPNYSASLDGDDDCQVRQQNDCYAGCGYLEMIDFNGKRQPLDWTDCCKLTRTRRYEGVSLRFSRI